MEKEFKSIRPLILLILLNILGAAILIRTATQYDESMAALCLIMCVLNIFAYLIINYGSLGDGYLFIIISMLSTIGIIMQLRLNSERGERQMKMYLIGVAFYFIAMIAYRIFHNKWNKLLPLYVFASGAMYIGTLLLGRRSGGALNWIRVGSVSVQPSEFIKILLVLSISAILTENRGVMLSDRREKWKMLIKTAVVVYFNAGFLLLQREWGTALLFIAVFLVYLYIFGESKPFLFLNLLAGGFAGFIGCSFMSHIRVRIEAWRNPWADPTGKGYQILQSLIAIGTGGFSGAGIGYGSGSIPAIESDFIFAAICEEMGVLGGVAIILLFFLLVYRGFKIALSCVNIFNKAVAVGLSAMLGIQTFIIVGGVIKLIPLTGITLPFVSHGGSSMIATFASLGILQGISGMKQEVSDEIK